MAADGPGNFENDSASDLVAGIMAHLERELRPVQEVEFIDYFMAALEMKMLLVKHCGAVPPRRDQIEAMRAQVMSLYDQQIDGLQPTKDFKRDRRAVLVATFDNCAVLAAP